VNIHENRDSGDAAYRASLSRRGLLVAASAAASTAALTTILGAGSAAAGSTEVSAAQDRVHLSSIAPQAGIRPMGATVSVQVFPKGTNPVKAANLFDGYVGRPMGLTSQKIYFEPGEFPANKWDNSVGDLANAGVELILCFKPSPHYPYGDLSSLAETLKMYRAAGVTGGVVLWQEPELAANDLSPSDFFKMWNAYGPTVRKYYPLIFNVGAEKGEPIQDSYYPGNVSGNTRADAILVDFYCETYVRRHVTLATLEKRADRANPPIPIGIGELGVTTCKNVPTKAEFASFVKYLETVFTNRISAGRKNSYIMYWNGNKPHQSGVNSISGPDDWKITYLDNMYNALAAASKKAYRLRGHDLGPARA
jgi:hypothetical protein